MANFHVKDGKRHLYRFSGAVIKMSTRHLWIHVVKTTLVPIQMNPWDSREYEMLYGLSQYESGLDVTLRAM
eukprot:13627662-Ditylum_brightwellii.AAC.1